MKRIELYIDGSNRLSLSVFRNESSEYESYVFHGEQTYEYIKGLATSKVVKVYRCKNKEDVIIECDNYIIKLNEYDDLILKRGMGPLRQNIKKYLELENFKKITNQNINQEKIIESKQKCPKVTRKNRHSGKRLLASTLVLFMLGPGIYQMSKNSNDKDNSGMDIDITIGNDDIKQPEILDEIVYEEESNDSVISINYEDRSLTQKAYLTNLNYGSLISKYAKIYGLDENLVLAIATQERGTHSTTKDKGGATGLMQLQNSVWEGASITAYNFKTNSIDKEYITPQKISNLETNVKISCMYLQNCKDYMNNNTLATIQCYNMGYGNMIKILTAYAKDTNKSVTDILNNPKDTGWLDYRYIITKGDKNYIENVLSWIGSDVVITNSNKDNTQTVLCVSNNLENNKIY